MAFGMYNSQNYFGQQQTQNTQMFPQSNGNVFLTNTSLEAANIPVGIGTTVALCLNENLMYLKSASNGVPTVLVYKLVPYVEPQKTSNYSNQTQIQIPPPVQAPQQLNTTDNSMEQRMAAMERQMQALIDSLNNQSSPKQKPQKEETIPWDA